MDPLNAVEARILGSLMEKGITAPDYYPQTLNALVNACNQSSNRDPVVAYGEADVLRGLDLLREKKLAFMFQGAQSRVAKFGHRVEESLELARPEASVLCVLLLRGHQTVGEIRLRTARMHEFASLDATEAALNALIARLPSPLAVRLPRQAGMKEQRYAHLLSGEVAVRAPAAEPDPEPALPAVSRETERLERLEGESAALRAEVAELRRQLEGLRRQLL
jgi:uncharacterized protein YceH (UPF0502 family)